MTNHLWTIAAFVDGERIDPAALKRALADEDGREYLVELVALREVMTDTMPTPAEALAPSPTRSTPWMRLAAAAAVIITVGAAGYGLGRFTLERRVAAEREAAEKAPTPTREVPDVGTTWTETTGGL